MSIERKKNYSPFLNFLSLIFITSCLGIVVNAQINDEKNVEENLEHLNKCYRECGDDVYINSLSPQLFYKSGIINQEEEQANLDSFFITLANQRESQGFIVVYGGKLNKYGEIDARVKRIKDYLKLRNFPPDPINFVFGGFREKFEFEFWMSRVPNAYPPLLPTISPEKVRFKGKMKPFVNVL